MFEEGYLLEEIGNELNDWVDEEIQRLERGALERQNEREALKRQRERASQEAISQRQESEKPRQENVWKATKAWNWYE